MPSARALGDELGALAGRLLTEGGVDLRTGVTMTGFVDGGGYDHRVAVELGDGTRVGRRRRGRRHRRGAAAGAGWPAPASDDPRRAAPAIPPDACTASSRVGGGRRRRLGRSRSTATGTATSTGPAPPTRPRSWPATSSAPSPRPPRCPTSGPTSSGSRSSCVGRPEHADSVLPLHGDGARRRAGARHRGRLPRRRPARGRRGVRRGAARRALPGAGRRRGAPRPTSVLALAVRPSQPGQRNILRSTAQREERAHGDQGVADLRVRRASACTLCLPWSASRLRVGALAEGVQAARRARPWPARSRAGWCPGRAPRRLLSSAARAVPP